MIKERQICEAIELALEDCFLLENYFPLQGAAVAELSLWSASRTDCRSCIKRKTRRRPHRAGEWSANICAACSPAASGESTVPHARPAQSRVQCVVR